MATWADDIVLKFDWRHAVKRELLPFYESIIKPTASFISLRGIEKIFKHIFPKLRWCSRKAFIRRIHTYKHICIYMTYLYFSVYVIQTHCGVLNICIEKENGCIQTPHDNNTIIIGYAYNKKKTVVNTHVDFLYLFFTTLARSRWVPPQCDTQRDVYWWDITRRIEDKRPCLHERMGPEKQAISRIAMTFLSPASPEKWNGRETWSFSLVTNFLNDPTPLSQNEYSKGIGKV